MDMCHNVDVCAFPPPHQLFIKSNQGDEETTKINYLTFIGTPVQATNMNDFRRVWASCNNGSFRQYCFSNAACLWFLIRNCFRVGCGKERRESLSRGEPEGRMRRGRGCGYIQVSEDCPSAKAATNIIVSVSHTHMHTHSLQLTSRSLNEFFIRGESVYKSFVW